MKSLPSGSRWERAMSCLASTVLPKLEISGTAAQSGTWKHLFFGNLRTGLESALASVPEEYRDACESINPDDFKGLERFDSETKYVYDVATHKTRIVTEGGSREYGELAPSEIPMQLDVSGVGHAEVMVADLKTGHSFVTPAAKNWQLAVGALAMSALHGIDHARVALIHAPEGMNPWWDVAVLDGFELMERRAQLIRRTKLIHEAWERPPEMAPMVIGEHCRYCPSKLHCPAHTGLIQRVAAKPEEAVKLTDALTADKARQAYETAKVLRQVLNDVEARLKEYAEEHPITLPDGRTYGPKPGTETTVDANVVRETLANLYGPDIADRACEFEASKASVERALRGVYEKRKSEGVKVTLKGLSEEAMGAIAENGGLKTRDVVRVKEF